VCANSWKQENFNNFAKNLLLHSPRGQKQRTGPFIFAPKLACDKAVLRSRLRPLKQWATRPATSYLPAPFHPSTPHTCWATWPLGPRWGRHQVFGWFGKKCLAFCRNARWRISADFMDLRVVS